jgi:hypothetical protein
MTPITFAEVALQVAANGYRPFPGRQRDKVPAIKGWPGLNAAPWDDGDLVACVADFQPPDDFCCCMAVQSELVVYDIDILDPQDATAAEAIADRVLGQTPLVRIGRAPKSTRWYRNAGGIRSSKQHPLETFSGSGQVIGFGWHREADRPYVWPCDSLLSLRSISADIPIVTLAQDALFRRELFSVIARSPRQGQRPHIGGSQTIGDRLRLLTRMKGCWRLAAAQVLEEAVEGNRNDTGWSVVVSAAACGIPESEVIGLFLRHFRGWDGFSEADLHGALARKRPAPLKSDMNFSSGRSAAGGRNAAR